MIDTTASLQAVDGRWEVSGPMTIDSAAQLLTASQVLAPPEAGVVDLARVEHVDSAGVSLLLAWTRRAAAEGRPLRFAGVPANMTSLAQLYGVEDLLR